LDTNNLATDGDSFSPAINANGAVIAFSSRATTLTTDNLFSSTNIFASVLAGGLIGGGVGTINLGPVCFPAGQGIAPNAIELTWGFPGVHNEQLRGFKVEINRKEGSQFKQIAKVPADGKANYIDTSLKANTRYEYRLWIEDPKGFAYSVDFAAKTQKKNKKNK
ncbi:MAG: fibronectin type III domain-containing protein, partial [Blastocatellia bacterium]|nr:fibronectin type III domain-containing protein [Blastocatellia bacterium]